MWSSKVRVGWRAALSCIVWIGCGSDEGHADGDAGGSQSGSEETTSPDDTSEGEASGGVDGSGGSGCGSHDACDAGTYCDVAVGCVAAPAVPMCTGSARLARYDNLLPQMSSPNVLEMVSDGGGSHDVAAAFDDVLAGVRESGTYVAKLSGPIVAITGARTGGEPAPDVVAVTTSVGGYEIHRWDWTVAPPVERSVRMMAGAVPWSISASAFFGVEDLLLASDDGLFVLPDDGSAAVTITTEVVESAFAAGLLDEPGDEIVGHVGGVSTYWQYDGTAFHATPFADTGLAQHRALTWARAEDERPVIGVTPQSGGALLFTWHSDGVTFDAPTIEALPLAVDRIVAGNMDYDGVPDLAAWTSGGDTVLVRLTSAGCWESYTFDDGVTAIASPPRTADIGAALLVGHGPGIERFLASE